MISDYFASFEEFFGLQIRVSKTQLELALASPLREKIQWNRTKSLT